METKFTNQFFKDLDRLNQPSLKKKVEEIIEIIEKVPRLSELKNLKKLQGHSSAYRIRCGDYRIGLVVENNVVKFARIANRKDIYKIFP